MNIEKGIRLVKKVKLKLLGYIHGCNSKGTKVLAEDWNYLIVLDACRYDCFEKVNWIEGKLEKRISLGTNTPEWMKRNFEDGYYDDIIYISANPFVLRDIDGFKMKEHFYKVIHIFDDKIGSLHPKKLNKVALKVIRRYYGKRFIIHYLQPHHPFLLRMELTPEKFLNGLVDVMEWKQAYLENLVLVLEYVDKLLDVLDGKIIITSDHGEMLGEFGEIGHGCGVRFRELVEVPWFRIENGG